MLWPYGQEAHAFRMWSKHVVHPVGLKHKCANLRNQVLVLCKLREQLPLSAPVQVREYGIDGPLFSRLRKASQS